MLKRLSSKCDYGTRAMLELARNHLQGPSKRKGIATSLQISPHYLEAILIILKTGNLIRTIRGANGGYELARKPAEISMLEILTVLDGPVGMVPHVDSPENSFRSNTPIIDAFWRQLGALQINLLKQTSLQSLLDSEIKPGVLDYAI